ncbi:DNA-directed DNA polymerase [Senna tora]|uniref:DNA-directed DNA polymerase n=1 Tax=Senna tora TaxID=362788 RepID=A0A835CJ19_9FABA|nr:DNA-directed DNA polymerase [Senna tora]
MAEEKTLKELDAPPVQQTPLCITATTLQAPLELKSGLIHLLPKFRGLANEDPYNHLKEFQVVCSITSWEQIMKTFLERYYPASRVNNVRRKLFGIKQRTHETLFDYWERFKELCASCPQHGIPEQALINFFYESLQPNARSPINGAAGGKGELTMRIQDAQVTFKMLNQIKSPKENEKSLKIAAAKEWESKAAIDGDLNNHQIDPREKSQKYLTEIDAADQFGCPTMLKAPPWCNKSKSPHHINQELPFTLGVQKNITDKDTRNWNSCKATSTPCALIDPG